MRRLVLSIVQTQYSDTPLSAEFCMQTDPPNTPFEAEDLALASELFEKFYEDLKAIACANRRKRGVADTFETVEILHNAFLKVSASQDKLSEAHFMSVATLAIRQVIIDYARRKYAQKRGGGEPVENLDDIETVLPEFSETPEEILQIAQLIRELHDTHPRWLRVLDARFFAGMTEDETAQMLNVHVRTIRRDWQGLKGWLAPRMGVRYIQES